jgi:hypothetical protein
VKFFYRTKLQILTQADLEGSGALSPLSLSNAGREDALATDLNAADCSARLAERFQGKANLIAQACFGIFAALNAVLDQNRMEEWHERRLDRSRGFRGIFDLEFAGSNALQN